MDAIALGVSIGGISGLGVAVFSGVGYIYHEGQRVKTYMRTLHDAAGTRNDPDTVLGTDNPLSVVYYLNPEERDSWYSEMPLAGKIFSRPRPRIRSGVQGSGSDRRRYFAAERYHYANGQIKLSNFTSVADGEPVTKSPKHVRAAKKETGFDASAERSNDPLTECRRNPTQNDADQLRGVTGYVAIYAHYKVTVCPSGKTILMAHTGPPRDVTITVTCETEWLTSIGRGLMAQGRSLTVTCVGATQGLDESGQELLIAPVAIYQPSHQRKSGRS